MFDTHVRIQILLQQGRLDDAEIAIRDALSKSMEDEWLHSLLACTLFRNGKPKEAEKSARTAIGCEPTFATAHYFLAQALLGQSRHREAIETVDEAIRLDPEDGDHFALKTQALFERNLLAEALETAEEGLRIDPTHEACRIFRSLILGRMGRLDEARADSDALLAEDPEDSWNFSARGWVLIQARDGEGAQRCFMEALRLDPLNSDAKEGLAQTIQIQTPVVGLILRVLIALERVPIWAIVAVFLLIPRLGRWLAKSDLPEPVQFAGHLTGILFFAIVLIVAAILPLQLFALRFTRAGRTMLSDDQRRAIRWSVGPLLIGMAYFLFWVSTGAKGVPIHSFAWIAACRLIYEVYEDPNPWLRRVMACLAGLAVAFSIWIEFAGAVILAPKYLEIREIIGATLEASAEGANPSELIQKNLGAEFKEKFAAVNRLKNWLTLYPTLLFFLIATFADDIRTRLKRYAPDET
ncbi:MAG: tetratricopeptide repeat protein [Verrucomicrobiae bacterium]|nr:tetratricopeptide repeat protein [Verrucomicrobiae bacterium]